MNISILRYDSIDSTNTEALKQAKLGASEGLCIVAGEQTAGHGRQGRHWVSEKDAGLYLSIILRPKIEARFLPLLTLMTAVAVHDCLSDTFDLKPDIKWPNDMIVNGKKICGILAETTETNEGLAIIIGIGINLKSTHLPAEIAATSIEAESMQPANPDDLLNGLTRFLAYFYDIMQSEDGPRSIAREWQRRSSYASGKSVKVALENEIIFGTTDGLEENGALRLKTIDGEIRIIQSGDVSNVRTIN